MSISSSFTDFSLPELFQLIDRGKKSGCLTVGAKQSLHLYGTPGQTRFDFMWHILLEKAHAYILLVDAHRPEHFRYSRKILHYFNQRASIPYLIGLTHTDCPGAWEAEDIALSLGLLDMSKICPLLMLMRLNLLPCAKLY
jgi:signal recognition particle receptor subunit beta